MKSIKLGSIIVLTLLFTIPTFARKKIQFHILGSELQKYY